MFDRDAANGWLLQAYNDILEQRPGARVLWLCDENLIGLEQRLPVPRVHSEFISNRFDIARALNQAGHQATFSDFNPGSLSAGQFDVVIYRLSKEKALVHYLLNLCQQLLPPGGQLLIAGHKAEGAKNMLDKAAQQLGSSKQTRKFGQAYTAVISVAAAALPPPLSDDNYPELRPVTPGGKTPWLSKPGQFGWRKIDSGSAFLIDTLQTLSLPCPAHLIDLGCGYGYLAVSAASLYLTPPALTLTDNNAAALLSAAANVQQNGLIAEIYPGDAGDTLTTAADLLLCNPPFHQGFSLSSELTDRFLAAAARLTTRTGQALFVVNAFIPLEKKAQSHFRSVTTLAHNRAYKVLRLTH